MESHILKSLNSAGNFQSDTIKLGDLEVCKKYLISDEKMVKTRYGEKVVVSLVDKGTEKVFLPDRFNKILTDDHLRLMTKQCYFIYLGKKDIGVKPIQHTKSNFLSTELIFI
ncbi:hypothetical protein TNCV_1998201 [Trichonephila clavipes]|uniref:Uncharacterized protein n=1 Tax=Trichonephila clavipes TaxID=2585209 RepID=A0A8X6RLG4_TRICX|nr:hypothetical protein TNCV_1998201 [Trichonephila clavipes]